MVLICISVMIDDVEHLHMCLLVILTSSLEKYIFEVEAGINFQIITPQLTSNSSQILRS